MNGDKLAKVLKGKEAEAVIETDGLDEYTLNNFYRLLFLLGF